MNTNQASQTLSVLDYKTYLTLSPEKKTSNFLKRTEIEQIAANIKIADESSFANNYQERFTKIPGSKHYTLRELLTEALQNSNVSYEQYEINIKRVGELVHSIFIEDGWLMKDIVVGGIEDKIYLIGGRHRLLAIAYVFANLAKNNCTDEGQIQALFSKYLEQSIRAIYMEVNEKDYILNLLIKDNESRQMRGAEKAHLKAQSLGADPQGVESLSKLVLDSIPEEAILLAGQNFARRHTNRMKQQTRQRYGENIARWLLYGIKPGERLNKKSKLSVSTEKEFESGMENAWELLTEIIKEKDVFVSRDIAKITTLVIERLSQEDNQKVVEENRESIMA